MFKCLVFQFLVILINFDLNYNQKSYEELIIQDKTIRRDTSFLSCNLTHLHGTTRNLKEIFFGRCHYYISYHHKIEKKCDFDSSKYDCDKLWESFYNITSKHTANVSDYDELLKLTDMNIPTNGSLFWSGTKQHVLDCKEFYYVFFCYFITFFLRYKNKKYLVFRRYFDWIFN